RADAAADPAHRPHPRRDPRGRRTGERDPGSREARPVRALPAAGDPQGPLPPRRGRRPRRRADDRGGRDGLLGPASALAAGAHQRGAHRALGPGAAPSRPGPAAARRGLALPRRLHRLRQRQLSPARHPSRDPDRPLARRAAHPRVRGLRGLRRGPPRRGRRRLRPRRDRARRAARSGARRRRRRGVRGGGRRDRRPRLLRLTPRPPPDGPAAASRWSRCRLPAVTSPRPPLTPAHRPLIRRPGRRPSAAPSPITPTRGKPMSHASAAQKTGLTDRRLTRVEWAGTTLPEPFMLFLILFAITGVVSTAMAWAGVSVTVPGTDEPTVIRGLFTGEGMTWLTTNLGANYVGFPPLVTVLPILLAIGIAQHSGLLGAAIRKLFGSSPAWLLPCVVGFVGVVSSIMADSAFVVVPPLAALVFKAAGRHPMAGLLGGFAAAGAGYST